MREWLHFLVPLLLLTASCEHKELCYNHPHTAHLNVEFDWSRAPEANPKTMSVYFFEEDGTNPSRYEFIDINGSEIRIDPGRYKAICHNSDTREVIHHGKKNYKTFMLTTKGVCPEPIWTDYISEIDIDDDGQTITFTPAKAYCNYSVEVRNVENIKYLSDISGEVTSMSKGWFPGVSELSSECTSFPFELRRSVHDKILSGNMITFGDGAEHSEKHELIIYASISDGKSYCYTFDVTDQIHNAPDRHNVHIMVDGLRLPKPTSNSGGLKPSVNEWHAENIEITM